MKELNKISKHSNRFPILLLLLALLIPLRATAQSQYHNILKDKLQTIKLLKQEINADEHEQNEHLFQLAQTCHIAGCYNDALVYYNNCLKSNLFTENSLFNCAYIYLKQGNLARAAQYAAKIKDLKLAPLIHSMIEFSKNNFGNAEFFANKILEHSALCPQALFQKAKILLAREKTDEAIELLIPLAQARPAAVPANYLLADIMLSRKRNLEKAEQYLNLSLKDFPLHADSHRLLGIIHFRKKDMAACEASLNFALTLDPCNFAARSALGNGRIASSYGSSLLSKKLPLLRQEFSNYNDPYKYNEAIDRLKQLARTDNSPQVLTDLATIYYYLGNLEEAVSYSNKALQLCNHWGLSHFIISLAQQKKVRQQDSITAAVEKTILSTKVEKPDGLERIFINFDSLSPRQQQLVLISIAPVKQHLKKVHEAGGTFYFLPLNYFLWEADRSIVKRGQRTFDGRLWDDVKGVGGSNSVTGTAELDEALEGGFNVFAHEFAHQIHYMALSDSQKQRIKELYQQALERGITLDYYAAANDMEYFAQGYEAYVSTMKRAMLKSTACHTRQELLNKDPELFRFIVSLSK